MKISELIQILQSELDANGDNLIQFCSDDGGWIGNLIESDPIIYTRNRSDHEDSDYDYDEDCDDNSPVGNVSVMDFFEGNDKILQFGFDISID